MKDSQDNRNNFEAEKNIERLLAAWRSKGRKIIHIKHLSQKPSSIFFKDSLGCEFLENLKPLQGELVIEKTKSSGFAETDLEGMLGKESYTDIILAGFTANECIDATARDAAALGFNAFVASDATATFDLRDSTGKIVKADRIHKLTLLNINAFFAKVATTDELLK